MQPLVIKDWQKGIANSPHEGFGLMRNVDIDAFPGAVKVQKAMTTLTPISYTGTFTADDTTDIMTTATAPITGTAVTVSNSGGALPTGLSASTTYFVINVSGTTFKLATTLANALSSTAIDITGNGTGTQTVTTVPMGTITHQVYDASETRKYHLDSNGRVWYNSSTLTTVRLVHGNTLTNTHGNGLAMFIPSNAGAVYLFVFRDNAIDVANVSTVSVNNPTWSNAWKTMNTSAGTANSHEALLGQDNIIYFCDGRYVGSIMEVAAAIFDPANAATYTYNNQALDLPVQEIAQCLEEQGINLLIGGNKLDKVYPWDRISDSFGIPLQVPEYSIKKLENMGGVVYIFAGTNGNIYQTPGTYVKHFVKLPDAVANNSSTLQATVVTWGGVGSFGGKLLVGAGVLTSGNSGVYSIKPDGTVTIDNIPSTGSTNVTAIVANDEYYTIGYAGGIDVVTTSRYSSYQTVIQSALYRVGTKTTKAKYSTLEVQIADPATTGNIRVSYRRDTTSSFTTLATFSADSSATSFRDAEIGLTDLENLQVQVEMDGNIQLVEVRLIP